MQMTVMVCHMRNIVRSWRETLASGTSRLCQLGVILFVCGRVWYGSVLAVVLLGIDSCTLLRLFILFSKHTLVGVAAVVLLETLSTGN